MLNLSIAKTELMLKRHTQRQIPFAVHSTFIEDQEINRVCHTKSLVIYIYQYLSWSKHVSEIAGVISPGFGALKGLRQLYCYIELLSNRISTTCHPVWDCLSNELAHKLQSKISSRFDYFAWSMRRGKDDNIESDLRCINPWTPGPEGFY